MSRICQVTGKRPMYGNNVSHAKNTTRRRFLPNLHTHRFWVEGENRWVSLRVSSKGMRIIDKNGIDAVLADIRKRHFYTTTKNKRTMQGKMEIKKFDPVVRKHVMYKEGKIK
ncbi:unnamed protein product [Cyprideis torosa]|uniref:Large ribosomal subunit protein bL28c n=1 Tax=Cyprideis torosa TaxID=163714 RepID=A0A7R8VZT6_9CRUS|nr:unnamed protein product [Cyprideis torosa]CAG0878774.1 unnamed protein product [Cyprideis torosa]